MYTVKAVWHRGKHVCIVGKVQKFEPQETTFIAQYCLVTEGFMKDWKKFLQLTMSNILNPVKPNTTNGMSEIPRWNLVRLVCQLI